MWLAGHTCRREVHKGPMPNKGPHFGPCPTPNPVTQICVLPWFPGRRTDTVNAAKSRGKLSYDLIWSFWIESRACARDLRLDLFYLSSAQAISKRSLTVFGKSHVTWTTPLVKGLRILSKAHTALRKFCMCFVRSSAVLVKSPTIDNNIKTRLTYPKIQSIVCQSIFYLAINSFLHSYTYIL